MSDEVKITVGLRVPFTDESGFTGQTVHLSSGHSFQSWDARSYGDGPVLAKNDWVKVIDGSDTQTNGQTLIEGQIISLRDNTIWVYNPKTKDCQFGYPQSDQIIKAEPPKPI